jgi:glutathione S-transferase
MLTLHHLEYSQSFRILWLLEELGVPYELISYARDPATLLAPKEYKALSPLGTAPVITDGELLLAETNAIVDYLLDVYPNEQLRPPAGAPNRARYLFWFHAAQGSLMPLLLVESLHGIIRKRVPFFMKPFVVLALNAAADNFLKPRMKTLLAEAEADLGEVPWFGGDALTAADIVLSYSMESARLKGHLAAYPNCRAWLERMRAQLSFQRAMEKDGRDQIVLAL